MSLHSLLHRRAEAGHPVTLGVIGAGRMGTDVLSQARRVPGIRVLAVADREAGRAGAAAADAGWPTEALTHGDVAAARRDGTTAITDDPFALIAAEGVEVVLDATAGATAGVAHARACVEHGRHLVMANLAADVVAGPLLAAEFEQAGLVYSLAYGDQPALICEFVDWARTAGFEVVAAGKGTQYLDSFHLATPANVWDLYGIPAERAHQLGLNARTYTAALDGTKAGIEMAAVANAAGLHAPPRGLRFAPVGVADLAHAMRPAAVGGKLHRAGEVEVVSSLERDGRPIRDHLRWGIFLVLEAPDDRVARALAGYGLRTDISGHHAALTRPVHLAGLEMTVSVASAALRGEPTGAPTTFAADVVAVAKRDLREGETLDGDGGACAWGMLLPAETGRALDALPIGLSRGARLTAPVAQGEVVTHGHVALDDTDDAVRARRAMAELMGA